MIDKDKYVSIVLNRRGAVIDVKVHKFLGKVKKSKKDCKRSETVNEIEVLRCLDVGKGWRNAGSTNQKIRISCLVPHSSRRRNLLRMR